MARWTKAFCFLLAAGAACATAAGAQQFEVRPGRAVIAGNPVEISLTGLPPNTEVEVRTERVLKAYWERGAPVRTYRSDARFLSDARGSVELHASPSLGGSFTGTDPSGLFWSMQPVQDGPAASETDDVKLTASIAGRAVANSSFRMLGHSPGFRAQPVPGFAGSYFAAHPSPGRHPVIIIVDGADDGSNSREMLMPRLVAQGFSVFHFATYALVYGPGRPTVEGLPTRYVGIPVDRLQAVRD